MGAAAFLQALQQTSVASSASNAAAIALRRSSSGGAVAPGGILAHIPEDVLVHFRAWFFPHIYLPVYRASPSCLHVRTVFHFCLQSRQFLSCLLCPLWSYSTNLGAWSLVL